MEEQIVKLLVVGEFNVGKTSAIIRYVDGKFKNDTKSTIDVDFSLKHLRVSDQGKLKEQIPVSLQIWDIAGEHKFREIFPIYIEGTKGVILVFDGNLISTLEALHDWIKIINIYINLKNIPIILISTKQDLKPEIDFKLVDNFKRRYNIKEYIQTSAKSGEKVDFIFTKISQLIVSNTVKHILADSTKFNTTQEISC